MISMLIYANYDEISNFADLGPVSSLEFKDSAAAKKYLSKQITTANSAGKMGDLFAMAIFESIKSFSGDSADIYQQTQAESYRLVNVVGVPAPVNFDSWLAFLSSAEEAALAALEREKAATWENVAKETAAKTKKDIKDKTDPRKSFIPWLVGGAVLLFVLR
jgi:hypothetical protein